MEIYPNKFMAGVFFVKWLKTFIILIRLHKQNPEILGIQAPMLQPSSHKKVESLTTLFSFLQGYPQTMVSLKAMLGSLISFFSAAFVILGNEFIPPALRSLFCIVVHYFFTPQFTVIIEENAGLGWNQIYAAATTYLRTKISYSSKSKRIKRSEDVV